MYRIDALATTDIKVILASGVLPVKEPIANDPAEIERMIRLLDPNADPGEWLFRRLGEWPDLGLQVARRVLSGSVTRLAPDPRLDPAPWPLRPSLRPEGTPAESLADTRYPRDPAEPTLPAQESVVVSVAECEAAPGSKRARRYRLWRVGATIGELRTEGLRISDLRRDIGAGRVVLGYPEATDD